MIANMMIFDNSVNQYIHVELFTSTNMYVLVHVNQSYSRLLNRLSGAYNESPMMFFTFDIY